MGIPNPDTLVDSLTPEQWQYWQAVAIIDGWANGWTQTAEVMAMLANQTSRQLASNPDHPRNDPLMKWQSGNEIAQQMTKFTRKASKRSNMLTPEQAMKVLESRNK